eukprot:1024829-Rhodomonas_salina.1
MEMGLPSVIDMIQSLLGLGSTMSKQDLSNMFYSFQVLLERWTLLGVRHAVTGQSYVMPVLPMGFALSLPIACSNTPLLADIINEEMTALWEGRPCLKALEGVPRA